MRTARHAIHENACGAAPAAPVKRIHLLGSDLLSDEDGRRADPGPGQGRAGEERGKDGVPEGRHR
ncbi:MAG: hypothetical protein PVJ02_19705, partial [Gemmatimonadota bacterium]